MIEEETWEFPKIGSKKQRIYYTAESFQHPAKMDVNLTRRLLKTFTREGDVVLDPMAGVGTTVIEAVLLNRNVVGVDIEEKFVKLCQENLENVKQANEKSFFKVKLGKAQIITGDSRHLSKLLQDCADTIVTSPPYAAMKSRSTDEENLTYTTKRDGKNIGTIMKCGAGDIKTYGEVDAIVTSPPYSEQLQAKGDYEKRKERLKKAGHTKATHGLLRGQESTSKVIGGDERYSEKRENIGNLKHGEMDPTIERLREHGRTDPKQGGPYGKSLAHPYSQNPKNIDNLKHGQSVDTIITSPPFGEENSYQIYDGPRATNRKGDDSKTRVKKDYEKSEHPENIAKLKEHGKVDTIITSPPYAETVGHQGGLDKSDFKHGCRFRDHYPKDKANIGNLPKGEVDSIITSPPYASGGWKADEDPENPIRREQKRKESFPMRPPDNRYSANPVNIQNLPYESQEKVDVILTSPPYADIHQCPTSTGLTEFFRKQLEEKGYIEWNGKRYTEAEWRAMNHGRLDGRSTPGVKKDAKYSNNPENIGNLPLEGSVDTIITSPPYSEGIGHACHIENLGVRTDEVIKQSQAFRAKAELSTKHMLIKMSEENIGSLKHGDVADAIITSPPYHDTKSDWDRKSRASKEGEVVAYSDEVGKARENIGNIHYYDEGKPLSKKYSKVQEGKETYLDAMLKCYEEMYKVLKPNGYCIVVLKNFIRNHKLVDLVGDTVKLCDFVGFKLVKKIRFKLPTKSFWRLLYERKWTAKFGEALPKEFESVYDYETVLVFQK